MSSPKIIIKSGIISNIEHFFNSLEYSGNKINKQTILFTDGSRREVSTEERIILSEGEQKNVRGILIEFKDGGDLATISYAKYRDLTEVTQECIRVEQLADVWDEEVLLTNVDGKRYHDTKDLEFFRYLSYIEGRPGAEKVHGHGLFGLTGDVSIQDAKSLALEHEDSIFWSHIISLPTTDGERLGYNTRAAWANLLKAKAPQIAKAYNISLNNLVIGAAYHSNTDNDHCHLLFYSTDPREGLIKGHTKGLQKASETLKSLFVNEIYRNELAGMKSTKTRQEAELKARLREVLAAMERDSYAPPAAVVAGLSELSEALRPLTGKLEYGYLPAHLKQQADDLLKMMVKDDAHLQTLYAEYMITRREQVELYTVDPAKISAKLRQIEKDFFSPGKSHDRRLHNLIVRTAAGISDSPTQGNTPAPGASSEGEKPDYRDAGDLARNFSFDADGGAFSELVTVAEPGASGEGEKPAYLDAGDLARNFSFDANGGALPEPVLVDELGASGEGEKTDYHAPVEKASLKSPVYGKSMRYVKDVPQPPPPKPEKKTPMQLLNQSLYRQIKEELLLDNGPLDDIAAALGDNPAWQHLQVSPEVKLAIGKYIAEFAAQEGNYTIFEAELEQRFLKAKKNPHLSGLTRDELLRHVTERFYNPDAYTNKTLQETILRTVQRLGQYRFAAQNSGRFYFSLKKEAFADKPDPVYDDLFERLRYFTKYPDEDELRQEINSIVGHLLTKNNLPPDMVRQFAEPDGLTPTDFHRTAFRFLRVLDQQRKVHELSADFFRTLREESTCEGKNACWELHERLKPLEDKNYQDLPEDYKNLINETVGNILTLTGADEKTVELFSHPAEDTPTGLHSITYFYLKRLDLQLFANEFSSTFYSALREMASDETSSVLDTLAGQIKDTEGTHYQELPDELQEELSKVAADLLASMEVHPDICEAFRAPDAFTPLGLHEQVYHVAKRLEQHRFVHQISSDFYMNLRQAIFTDTGKSNRYMSLFDSLKAAGDIPFNKLSDAIKTEINQIVSERLIDLKANPEMIRQLSEPDELTPLSLQNTALYFLQKLPVRRFIHDFSSAFFSSLAEQALVTGVIQTSLQEINRQLAQLKDPSVSFAELPDETKDLITGAVKELFEQHRIPPEVQGWFIPQDKDTLLSFHNAVRGYARYYHEHRYIDAHKKDFYRALVDSAKPANRGSGTYGQLVSIRDRLAAYASDARFDSLDDILKGDIQRLAYSLLANPDIPNANNIMARRLLMDKDAPKQFQNTVMRVACDLNEITRKANEAARRQQMSHAYHAVRLCLLIAKSLAQMSEANSEENRRQKGETRLEYQRTFNNRRTDRPQNYTEVGAP